MPGSILVLCARNNIPWSIFWIQIENW